MGKEVEVPKNIWKRLSKRAEKKGFDSCEAYINDVLRQVKEKLERKEEDEGNGNEDDKGKEEFSEEEEEKVRKRLRALGYLSLFVAFLTIL